RNKLSGRLSEKIGNLKNLAAFQIFENQMSGPAPISVGSLPNLEVFELHHNSFEGFLPESYGKLSKLRVFDLTFCSFFGLIPESLGGMTSLQGLYLNNNNFTGPIPDSILKIKSLVTVNIFSNKLYGDFTEKFKLLSPLLNISMQQNYFTGTISESTNFNTFFFDNNCFTFVRGVHTPGSQVQRSPVECETFYKSLDPSKRPVPSSTFTSIEGFADSSSPTSTTEVNKEVGPTQNNPGSPDSSSTATTGLGIATMLAIIGLVLALVIGGIGAFIFLRRKKAFQTRQTHAWNRYHMGQTGSMEGLKDSPSQPTLDLHPIPQRGPSTVARGRASKIVGTPTQAALFQKYGAEVYPAKPPASPTDTIYPDIQPSPVNFGKLETLPTTSTVPVPSGSISKKVSSQSLTGGIHLMEDYSKQPVKIPLDASANPIAAVFPLAGRFLENPRRLPSILKPSKSHSSLHLNVSDAASWSPTQVALWLESVDVSSRLALTLKEHEVTGYQLLLMKDERLIEMGVEQALSRKIVMEAVTTLRAESVGLRAAGKKSVSLPRYS
ncbi:hypothetical protein HDU97_002131, partial [Phlyctochytrium planicorne]